MTVAAAATAAAVVFVCAINYNVDIVIRYV